jgi:hypothetical protein
MMRKGDPRGGAEALEGCGVGTAADAAEGRGVTDVYVLPEPEFDRDDPDYEDQVEMWAAVGPMLLNEDGSPMELIPACRKIVAGHQCANVQGTMVDAFSASAFLQVYEVVSEKNRARIDDLGRRRGAHVAGEMMWKAIGKSKGD